MKGMISRNSNVDFLRALGLLLIILAHVNAPDIIKQIRCFDVPMMLFISGLCSSKKSTSNYFQQTFKRVKRLIVPVWFFLSIYLSLLFVFQQINLIPKIVDINFVLNSFLLNRNGGIGYVWIIRIFILISIVSPLLVWMVRKFSTPFKFLLIIFMGLVSLELLYSLSLLSSCLFLESLINELLMPIIAYSIPFAIGLLYTMDKKDSYKNIVCLFVLLSLYVLANYLHMGDFIVNSFKYPPRIFYIVYGVLMSLLVWSFVSRFSKRYNFMSFVGSNTIWIYLYHMPFTLFANKFICNWTLQYIFIFLCSIVCFYLQYRLVIKTDSQLLKKYFLG